MERIKPQNQYHTNYSWYDIVSLMQSLKKMEIVFKKILISIAYQQQVALSHIHGPVGLLITAPIALHSPSLFLHTDYTQR